MELRRSNSNLNLTTSLPPVGSNIKARSVSEGHRDILSETQQIMKGHLTTLDGFIQSQNEFEKTLDSLLK